MSLSDLNKVLTAGVLFDTDVLAENVVYITKNNTRTTIPVIFIEDKNTLINPTESIYIDCQAAVIMVRVSDIPTIEMTSQILRLNQVWSIRLILRLDEYTWRVNVTRTVPSDRSPNRVSSR